MTESQGSMTESQGSDGGEVVVRPPAAGGTCIWGPSGQAAGTSSAATAWEADQGGASSSSSHDVVLQVWAETAALRWLHGLGAEGMQPGTQVLVQMVLLLPAATDEAAAAAADDDEAAAAAVQRELCPPPPPPPPPGSEAPSSPPKQAANSPQAAGTAVAEASAKPVAAWSSVLTWEADKEMFSSVALPPLPYPFPQLISVNPPARLLPPPGALLGHGDLHSHAGESDGQGAGTAGVRSRQLVSTGSTTTDQDALAWLAAVGVAPDADILTPVGGLHFTTTASIAPEDAQATATGSECSQ
ncbi:hypothetical protein QJQ45_028684, partial [Haematococcus lacustris]